ncbi:hypothetical protein [Nocardia mangyaensis]|uniref:hypothetical protein n=1 Tax=Nocardia mangyaensis TaxID=2213200 RepID=UPI00267724C4|nr:hypothetical protein [Nocardia mangyaensis]MDO3646014.1 hypothetical protein [Nocardia mangyaensis]
MSTQNPGPPDQPEQGKPPNGGDGSPLWKAPDPGAGWPPKPEQPPTPPSGPGGEQQPRQGRMHRQEPGVTQPRPPTVAEARARDKARRDAELAHRAAFAAEEAKRRSRKRVMMGGVAVVGVAALVGGGYLAYRAVAAPEQVTASCVQVDENGKEIVVPDENCGEGKTNFRSDGGGGGMGSLLILGWPQYRYHYGGNSTIGQPPSGGTTVKPRNAEIKTKSGTTVQRGGLGSKSTGGSGS